jgi:lipid A 4'-phosphatase
LTDRNADSRPESIAGGALRSWLADGIVVGLVFVVVASVFFLIFPGVDLWFSRQFYLADLGFPVARLPAFIALRAFSNNLLIVISAVLVLALLAKLVRPGKPTPIRPHSIFFLISGLALGPGLLVNLILKDHWGRPRPFMVDGFGGSDPYVPVWQITNYCSTNCSFVSGEASASLWLVTLAFVVPQRLRQPVAIVAIVFGLLFSLNRIAFGGHFISDVVIAWGLTAVIVAALHRLFISHPPPRFTEAALEGNLTRAGEALRRLIPKRG